MAAPAAVRLSRFSTSTWHRVNLAARVPQAFLDGRNPRQVEVEDHDVRAAAGQRDDHIAAQRAGAARHRKGLAGEVVHCHQVITVHVLLSYCRLCRCLPSRSSHHSPMRATACRCAWPGRSPCRAPSLRHPPCRSARAPPARPASWPTPGARHRAAPGSRRRRACRR